MASRSSRQLNEALLEMAYFRPLADLFAGTYGTTFLKVLKYSQQHEVFVGFDQGWARTDADPNAVFLELKQAVAGNRTHVQLFRLAYFLQFKSMRLRTRRSPRVTGQHGSAPMQCVPPFFECDLDLSINAQTKRSQHEILRVLARVAGADVNYACPLITSCERLFDSEYLLDALQLVPPAAAPASWKNGEKHSLAFDVLGTNAHWCSEPVPAESVAARDWAAALQHTFQPDQVEELVRAAFESGVPPIGLTIWTFRAGPDQSNTRL